MCFKIMPSAMFFLGFSLCEEYKIKESQHNKAGTLYPLLVCFDAAKIGTKNDTTKLFSREKPQTSVESTFPAWASSESLMPERNTD